MTAFVTEFNNFVLDILTRLPTRVLQATEMINEFNLKQKQNISIAEGQLLINNFYSYIKETGIFYVKNYKVPRFKLTAFADRFFEFNEKLPIIE